MKKHLVSIVCFVVIFISGCVTVEEMRTKADLGDAKYQLLTGFCYMRGYKTEKNIEEAKKYLTMGFQSQSIYAACYLIDLIVTHPDDDEYDLLLECYDFICGKSEMSCPECNGNSIKVSATSFKCQYCKKGFSIHDFESIIRHTLSNFSQNIYTYMKYLNDSGYEKKAYRMKQWALTHLAHKRCKQDSIANKKYKDSISVFLTNYELREIYCKNMTALFRTRIVQHIGENSHTDVYADLIEDELKEKVDELTRVQLEKNSTPTREIDVLMKQYEIKVQQAEVKRIAEEKRRAEERRIAEEKRRISAPEFKYPYKKFSNSIDLWNGILSGSSLKWFYRDAELCKQDIHVLSCNTEKTYFSLELSRKGMEGFFLFGTKRIVNTRSNLKNEEGGLIGFQWYVPEKQVDEIVNKYKQQYSRLKQSSKPAKTDHSASGYDVLGSYSVSVREKIEVLENEMILIEIKRNIIDVRANVDDFTLDYIKNELANEYRTSITVIDKKMLEYFKK